MTICRRHLLCLSLLPLGARAEGDLQILSADYGSAERRIDVTDRLLQLVRVRVRFRIDNEAFGADPHPHRRKTLRVLTRGPQGEESWFEFGENDEFDPLPYASRGHEGGRRHDDGEYRLLEARWGTPQREADVSERVRELVARDRRFRASNQVLGVDPHPRRRKTLRLLVRERGGEAPRWLEFAEGSEVDGEQFRGGPRGRREEMGPRRARLEILEARYGAGAQQFDVGDLLRARLRGDRLALRVDNQSLGGDPAPHRRKQLWIRWRFEGQQREQAFNEGSWLSLP